MPRFVPSANNPYARESVEDRIAREQAFDSQTTQSDYDPSVLHHLRQPAEEVWEFEQSSRGWYEEDKQSLQNEYEGMTPEQRKKRFGDWDPRSLSFGQWANTQASEYAKMDPKGEAYADTIDTRLMAELMREFSRKEDRIYGFAFEQEQQDRMERMGVGGQIALGAAEGMMEFGNTITGGTMESAIQGVGEFFDEGYAERYAQGRAFMDDMTDRSHAGVRWAKGFGGLVGFILPAGAMAKGATAYQVALQAGKTGVQAGTKGFAIRQGVATLLGGAPKGGGLGLEVLSSAGNFVATGAALDFMRGINTGVQAALQGSDAQDAWAQVLGVWRGSEQMGEPGMLLNGAQSAIAGVSLPFLRRIGAKVGRGLTHGKNADILRDVIGEIPKLGKKIHATLANAAAGSVEFAGLSFLPNLHDENGPFGVVKDLWTVVTGEGDVRQAQEHLWFHVINGAVLKGSGFVRGKGALGPSKKQQIAALAGGVDKLGVIETQVAAMRASEDKLFVPTREEADQLRTGTENTARVKIAFFVTRRALENTLGKQVMDNLSVGEGMRLVDAETRRRIEHEINHAIEIIGHQNKPVRVVGKGPKVMVETLRGHVERVARLTPDEAKTLHRKVKQEILAQGGTDDNLDMVIEALLQRTGASPRHRGAGLDPREGVSLTTAGKVQLRKDIRAVLDEMSDADLEKLGAEVFSMQVFTEAAARMGMAPVDQGGVIDKIFKGLGERALETLRGKEAPTLEDKIRERVLELENLYEQNDATADLGEKQAIMGRAAKIETEVEQLRRGLQAETEREAQKIQQEQAQQIEPGASIRRPLSVGERPEPIDVTPEGSELRFPPHIVEAAPGTSIRIQVGKYDKEGVFRPAMVQIASPDAMIVRTEDGKLYRLTPQDVKDGRVRGGVISNIAERGDYPDVKPPLGKADRDGLRDFERQEIRDRGDTIESMEYREPDPMFGRAPTEATDDILFNMRKGKPGEGTREDFQKLAAFLRSQMLEAEAQDDAGRYIESGRLLGELRKSRGDANGVFRTPDHPQFDKWKEGRGEGPAPAPAKPKPKPKPGGGKARLGPARRAGPAPTPAPAPAPAPTPTQKPKPKPSKKPKSAPRFGSKRKGKKGKQVKGLRATVKGQARRIEELEGETKEALERKYRDDRTGLANADAWEAAQNRYDGDKKNAVWTGDLGNFKLENDTYGHKAGNVALRKIAEHLKELAREAGIPERNVFRTGGDEFTVAGTKEQIAKFGSLVRERNFIDTAHKTRIYIDGATGATHVDADAAAYREKVQRKLNMGIPLSDAEKKIAKKYGFKKRVSQVGKGQAEGRPSPAKPPARLGSKKKAAKKKAPKKKPATIADLKAQITDLADRLGIPAKHARLKADLIKQLADLKARAEGKKGERAEGASLAQVKGTPKHVMASQIPEGWTITLANKTGRRWTLMLRDPEGTEWVLRSGKGVQRPEKGFVRPDSTMDVSVVSPEGETIFRSGTTVSKADTATAYDTERQTGRIQTIERARARLGSFRRRNLVEKDEAGEDRVVSKTDDPVKRAFNTAGAMMSREGLTAEDIRAQMRALAREIQKLTKAHGENSEQVKRGESAYEAMRLVAEAKEFIEKFERQRTVEREHEERSAPEANPAKSIELSDAALGTSQRKARDLALEYRAWVDTETERLRGQQASVKEKGSKEQIALLRRKLDALRQIRRVADMLIKSAPGTTEHGRADISRETLPPVRIGDLVSIVCGGETGEQLVEGLIVGAGTPSKSSLRRGIGVTGQEVRRLMIRQRKGKPLTSQEQDTILKATLYPGKWITIFTASGERHRIRVSDIAEIGPKDFKSDTFAYDPVRGRMGVEVSERRFLSWFTPPDELPTSRMPREAGAIAQSIERVKMLLAGDIEGYWKTSGRGDEMTVTDLSGLEAAETEARVRASQIRNRTLTADQATLEANAMLVRPEARKVHESAVAKSEEKTWEETKAEYVEKKAAEREGREHRPAPEGQFRVHYFDPKEPLRELTELSDIDRVRYDQWTKQAEEADARRMIAEERDGTFDESRKLLAPLSFGEGEALFVHRTRGEGNVIRQGRTVLAERTPEGTIFARYISTAEAAKWMGAHGKEGEWADYKKKSLDDYRRMRAKNNRNIALAKGDTMLHEYCSLLHNQFERIAKDDSSPVFPHEGDLHERVREWLKENPYPSERSEAKRWTLNWENFLFRRPTKPTEVVTSFKDEEKGIVEVGVEQESFSGESLVGAGPLYIAQQRILLRKNPSNGDRLIYDEKTNQIRYADSEAEARDFYKAYAVSRGIDLAGRPKPFSPGTLGLFGLGMMPGGAMRHWRNLFGHGVRLTDDVLRGYNYMTRGPAHLWSQVFGGVTDFTKSATDTIFFDRIHDLLHHPDYGSSIIGESGKAMMRKFGVLFGESDEAPLARLHLNDHNGMLYELGTKAAHAVQKIRKLPQREQLDLLREFEAGRTPKMLEEYRDIMDDFGRQLVEKGLLQEADLERFRGRYIHFGRYVWKRGDIRAELDKATTYYDKIKDDVSVDKAERTEAFQRLRMLKRVWAKVRFPTVRTFIGSHPLDLVRKSDMKMLDQDGCTRYRKHKTIDEARGAGLDVSEPWRLLLEGMAIEGRALQQAILYEHIANDPALCKDIDNAPEDWIAVMSTRYSQHPVWERFHGKRIHPQTYHLLEANDPTYNRYSQAWDMLHGLVKASHTVGSFANWQTQILGNVMITASVARGIPFFQIGPRFARALCTLCGKGKDAEKNLVEYKRWNWTRHASDAVRDLMNAVDRGGIRTGADPDGDPYLGMGFFEKLTESVRQLGHGKLRRAGRGAASSMIDIFTSLDAMARIALHEWNIEQGMDATESRMRVDKLYDIQHLPKGWQFTRRYIDSFASIKALLGRNLAELAPGTPAAMINMGMAVAMHNMIMRQVFGYTEEEEDRLVDASIPKTNAFHEFFGKNIAMLYPKGNGTLGVIDMARWSPTDVGIRMVPGLRQLVSGGESLLWEGAWADDMDGKGFGDGIWDSFNANIVASGSINYLADRDPFNPGRNMRDLYAKPGILGLKGYPRYMMEQGPGPAIFSSMLPSGIREAVTPLSQSVTRGARRFAQASEGGALGIDPRFVVELDRHGNIVSRPYTKGEATMELFGFRGAYNSPAQRLQEVLERTTELTKPGPFGLRRTREGRTTKRGTLEAEAAKEAVNDTRNIHMLNKAFRLSAIVRAYTDADEDSREVLGRMITETIGAPRTLKRLRALLSMMGQSDHLDAITRFFEIDEHRKLIPVKERPSRPMRGRFGTLRKER